jgi:ribosome-associated translation inhibitor RaiA
MDEKHSLFPGWIPRPLKRKSSLHDVRMIPAHIRVLGANLSKDTRSEIRNKLNRKLGKVAKAIERVSVRVKDINGPRGGIDQVCRIKVVLSNLSSVVFEAQDASLDVAIGSALTGIERAARRSLQRRRMKPRKGAARSRAA